MQAPQAGAVHAAEHGDAQMHEAVATDADAHQASDAPPILAEQQAAAMPPLGNGQPDGEEEMLTQTMTWKMMRWA